MASDCSNYGRACFFDYLMGISKSVQVLFDGMDAIMLLTSIVLTIAMYGDLKRSHPEL